MKDKLQYRKTLFITRLNCPETNSSSSHSFALSKRSFCEEDLKASSQDLIPTITDDGKKTIILDGKVDDIYYDKRSNSSKVKLIYTITSIDYLFSKQTAKRKRKEVLEVVKNTLNIDEISVKHFGGWSIDHQSTDTLEQLLKTEGYLDVIRDFIFNPRSWLFFLWDSEDSDDNPIFDVLEDLSKFEISLELPILIEKFKTTPEIQNIELTKKLENYPKLETFEDFHQQIQEKIGYKVYSESKNSFIDDSRYVPLDGSWRIILPKAETIDDPDIFLYFTVGGFKEDLYMVYLRTTVWKETWDNLKKYLEKTQKDLFEEKYSEVCKWASNSWLDSEYLDYFIDFITPLTEKSLGEIGISNKDIKMFKINIYTREVS